MSAYFIKKVFLACLNNNDKQIDISRIYTYDENIRIRGDEKV